MLFEFTGGGNTKVYVGNVSYDTTWQSLKEHMRRAGPVVRADVVMGADGRSKVRMCVWLSRLPAELARANPCVVGAGLRRD